MSGLREFSHHPNLLREGDSSHHSHPGPLGSQGPPCHHSHFWGLGARGWGAHKKLRLCFQVGLMLSPS